MVFIALLLVNYETRHRRYGLPFKKKKSITFNSKLYWVYVAIAFAW